MSPLRVIFMGTAELSCDSLRALLNSPACEVVAVVTQPDRPRGRELELQPSPVKVLALQANQAVLQPERARDEAFLGVMRGWRPDLIAVAAYGQILPQGLLDLPRFGCLNVHTSLLPKYRGAAPIQWAILNGDDETGVTIMKMDAGLDTGDILAQHRRLARLGAELLVQIIPEYVAGRVAPRPQPAEGVSCAPKIKKQDGQLDWIQPARVIWNRVRGLVPWPGAFSYLPGQPHPHLLKIWQAEVVERTGPPGVVLQADKTGIVIGCGRDALRIRTLQREGGRRLPAQEFLAGHPLLPGQKLG